MKEAVHLGWGYESLRTWEGLEHKIITTSLQTKTSETGFVNFYLLQKLPTYLHNYLCLNLKQKSKTQISTSTITI